MPRLAASLTIQNSIIDDNGVFRGAGTTTDSAAGGGVFGSGFSISISNSTVTNNGVYGGSNSNGDGGNAQGGGVFGTGCSIAVSAISNHRGRKPLYGLDASSSGMSTSVVRTFTV